jgi:hypothetical protein
MYASGLNPTIYAARGEHTNQYTTDAVENAIVKNMIYCYSSLGICDGAQL